MSTLIMNSLEMCYLISKYLGNFYISFYFLYFNSLLVREYNMCEFNPHICYYLSISQNMICLSEYSMYVQKKYIFCCWVQYSINVNYIRLVDNIFQVFLTFTDFLSILSRTEIVDAIKYNYKFVYFCLSFLSVFTLCILRLDYLVHTHLRLLYLLVELTLLSQ